MLRLDDADLYDLSEAGRMLLAGPGRLRRLCRQGRIPGALVEGHLGLPRAWVDAEAGLTPTDADALARYWCERLAPPGPHAARPTRDARLLDGVALLGLAETARRLFADERRLLRLDAEGRLPALRVEGELRWDAQLVERFAREHEDEASARAADERRATVLSWRSFEYVRDLEAPPPAATRPAGPATVASAPRAWSMPAEIAGIPLAPPPDSGEEPEARSDAEAGAPRIIRARGFETVEEED